MINNNKIFSCESFNIDDKLKRLAERRYDPETGTTGDPELDTYIDNEKSKENALSTSIKYRKECSYFIKRLETELNKLPKDNFKTCTVQKTVSKFYNQFLKDFENDTTINIDEYIDNIIEENYKSNNSSKSNSYNDKLLLMISKDLETYTIRILESSIKPYCNKYLDNLRKTNKNLILKSNEDIINHFVKCVNWNDFYNSMNSKYPSISICDWHDFSNKSDYIEYITDWNKVYPMLNELYIMWEKGAIKILNKYKELYNISSNENDYISFNIRKD